MAAAVSEALSRSFLDVDVETGVDNGRLLAYLAAHGEVLSKQYHDDARRRPLPPAAEAPRQRERRPHHRPPPRQRRRQDGRRGVKMASRAGSRHDLFHHIPGDVGQAEVAAGVAEGQPLVVQAEQVQERGVQVVDVDLVLDGVNSRSRRSRRGDSRASRRRRPATW